MLISRRALFQGISAAPLFGAPAATPRRVVVTGGHPGDPECGCAGTIARLTARGDDVVLLYLNRGEGYCGGRPLQECASIRTREAENACRILRARAGFANQVDGSAVIDSAHFDAFAQILLDERPGAVFTHWPLDRHRDHRAIASLTLDAWLKSRNAFALYYYEVADDTMNFSPNEYVDIASVQSTRRAACYAHSSQQPDKWYPKQVAITAMRGRASGFAQAEAFFRVPESKTFPLP